MPKVTYNKVANGEFQVLKDGIITEWTIHNGSHGCTSAVNEYCLYNNKTDKVVRVGKLADAKGMVALYLK